MASGTIYFIKSNFNKAKTDELAAEISAQNLSVGVEIEEGHQWQRLVDVRCIPSIVGIYDDDTNKHNLLETDQVSDIATFDADFTAAIAAFTA